MAADKCGAYRARLAGGAIIALPDLEGLLQRVINNGSQVKESQGHVAAWYDALFPAE